MSLDGCLKKSCPDCYRMITKLSNTDLLHTGSRWKNSEPKPPSRELNRKKNTGRIVFRIHAYYLLDMQ